MTVVIALGSNLGDRRYHLLRAIHELRFVVRVVRVSSIHETAPVDAPEGSPPFLNTVLTGYTSLEPLALLDELLALEQRLGRVRRGTRNGPRVIDLDLILHGATRMRTRRLTLPHPRAHEREFVLVPLREVWSAVTAVTAFPPAAAAAALCVRVSRTQSKR
ncbi:MAG TPA: 2-amino-4-hydroxy-6-hydroxymethyldihydropteridine diphosphokinase [Thermoanaerobaculia bacterium]|nr:2-amino-4-hydroxy-6-hydroxymethyldihydropteridine diphosphokinase [Thermoanaerobaculia bacterium]